MDDPQDIGDLVITAAAADQYGFITILQHLAVGLSAMTIALIFAVMEQLVCEVVGHPVVVVKFIARVLKYAAMESLAHEVTTHHVAMVYPTTIIHIYVAIKQ